MLVQRFQRGDLMSLLVKYGSDEMRRTILNSCTSFRCWFYHPLFRVRSVLVAFYMLVFAMRCQNTATCLPQFNVD